MSERWHTLAYLDSRLNISKVFFEELLLGRPIVGLNSKSITQTIIVIISRFKSGDKKLKAVDLLEIFILFNNLFKLFD